MKRRTDGSAAEVHPGRERSDAAGAGGEARGRKDGGQFLPLPAVRGGQLRLADSQFLGRTADGSARGAAERDGAILGFGGPAARIAGGAVLLCV